jgi:hypothetical protein
MPPMRSKSSTLDEQRQLGRLPKVMTSSSAVSLSTEARVIIKVYSGQAESLRLLHGSESWLRAVRGAKINSSDPPLTAVRTAYATPPFPPFCHPPIELAGIRPFGRLNPDRRIDSSAISFSTLSQVVVAEIHI